MAVGADGELLGFAVVAYPLPGACELEDLFVEPPAMGQRIGTMLVEDAAERAAARGSTELAVTANPDATGFYERVGFRRGEEVPTQFRPGLRMQRGLG